MYSTYEKRIVDRLTSLVNEITGACEAGYDYHDRIRAFKGFCDETPVISQMLEDLPDTTYDFGVNWRDLDKIWPGGIESYGMRWNAITQIVSDSEKVHSAWPQLAPARGENMSTGLHRFTNMFVVPIYDFIIDRIESASVISYTLLRYKRWAEWFEADRLRKQYEDHENQGEAVLDEDLRKFLFESGIDYPFSQPASPGGRVDVAAKLETDDPLVLEIKVWDSSKGYKENRVRDGLRQARDYAIKYGKERGYVALFNLDPEPLEFSSDQERAGLFPSIELGGRTFFFMDIHIAEKKKSISQQDKGKKVKTKEIDLESLRESID